MRIYKKGRFKRKILKRPLLYIYNFTLCRDNFQFARDGNYR